MRKSISGSAGSGVLPGPAPQKGDKVKKLGLLCVFVGPVFVLYTLFFTVPFIEGMYYSFTDWKGLDAGINWVGFDNYIKMFTADAYFTDSLVRTFYIAALNVFFTNVLAMLFALALTSRFRFNNIYRTLIFLPNVISMVISGFIWQFMFTKVSANIYKVTGIEFFNQSWLSDEKIVVYSIIIVSVWWGLGYIMTIYIAAIQGIDASMIEAAEIDGASEWQLFFRIKLPSMLPTVAVGIFLNVSGSLKIFDTIYALTAGGPGKASEVAMLNLYREAFVRNQFGYGNAKAIILTVIVIVVTIIQLKVTRKEA